MNVRAIGCFLLALASPALPWPDSQSHAGIVIPDLGFYWLADSSMATVAVPKNLFVDNPVSKSPLAKPRGTQQRYDSSHPNRLPFPDKRFPFTPPIRVSPRIGGQFVYGTSSYDRLPAMPTAPTAPYYGGAPHTGYVQPWDRNWSPRPAYYHPDAAVGSTPIRKPFSDYRPPPAISPYSYLYTGDPSDTWDYYFYVRPLLEQQESNGQ